MSTSWCACERTISIHPSIHKTNFAVIMLPVESATEFLDEQKRKKNCRWALEWSSTTHCLWRKWWFKQRLSTSFSSRNLRKEFNGGIIFKRKQALEWADFEDFSGCSCSPHTESLKPSNVYSMSLSREQRERSHQLVSENETVMEWCWTS